MNHSMSYMQYRTHKSLNSRWLHYIPCGVLLCFIIITFATAEYLRIDWNRLLFNEVNHVRIEGKYKYIDRFEIERLLSPFLGGAINKSEMHAIAKMLEELPWVKNVLIKHSWLDNTLILTVQQREAVAYWGKQALLDVDAEVFRPTLIDNEDMPRLDASVGREKQILDFYRQLSEWLHPIGMKIIHIYEDPSRSYTVQLDNASRLILGRHLFEPRIKRFIAAYRAGFADYIHQAGCIDLRYLDGFAVRWKEPGVSLSC